MSNYTIYHCHSDLSVLDSVTKYQDYIKRAKECGMSAFGLSNHGVCYQWDEIKENVEAAGMKYIFATEAYLTASLKEKVRDNYHCVLIARDYEGVKEILRLSSRSFNRDDGHMYYNPRISFDELFSTSDHVIFTSACIAGPLCKGSPEDKEKFLNFMVSNKDRCFFEIQHHIDPKQVEYNKLLWELSQETGVKLIAGTDTHALNAEHAEGRKILLAAKGVHYDGEDNFDLTFKTYEELVEAYKTQNSLPESAYLQAIENTNVMADMVEQFEIDCSSKFPHIYNNSEEIFKQKINEGYKNNPYFKSHYKLDQIRDILNYELDVYKSCGAIDYMLLEAYIVEWEKKNGVQRGFGRGSCCGSLVAALLGVTEVDPIRFSLLMERFLAKGKKSNPDIDTDYGDEDREKLRSFLLKDHLGLPQIHTAEIITFNTIQLKGAVKEVGRYLGMPLDKVQEISDAVQLNEKKKQYFDETTKRQYPELTKYAEMLSGAFVSVGSHPSGIIITDFALEDTIGTCYIKGDDNPVSQINMSRVDHMGLVKLDLLGLDNIRLINETCRLAGIKRISPYDVDTEDELAWKELRDDTTMIFQFESDSATEYIKKFYSDSTLARAKESAEGFSRIEWLAFVSAALRPGCASFRDRIAEGISRSNGLPELDKMLSKTMGELVMQEDLMKFCVKFCGYSFTEADFVRKCVSKKKGTEQLIPELKSRFIDYTSEHYGVSKEDCEKIIEPFIQTILDSAQYSFNLSHAVAYGYISYISAYLRAHYRLEFVTAALNTFADKADKTAAITAYAIKHKIRIEPIKFRHSQGDYSFDRESNTIFKGISSIKYLNNDVAEAFLALKDKQYGHFSELLFDVYASPLVDKRQIEVLIRLDFFSEFGTPTGLLDVLRRFDLLYSKASKKYKATLNKQDYNQKLGEGIREFAGKETEKSYTGFDAAGYLKTINTNLSVDTLQQVADEYEYLGYGISKDERYRGAFYVVDNVCGRNQYLKVYSIATGKEIDCRIRGTRDRVRVGNILIVKKYEYKPAMKSINGEWKQVPGKRNLWITQHSEKTFEKHS